MVADCGGSRRFRRLRCSCEPGLGPEWVTQIVLAWGERKAVHIPKGGIDPERWQRLRELFDAVLDMEASDRPGFISRSCGGDPNLQSTLESLIEHSLETGSAFDQALIEAIDLEGSTPTGLDLLGRTLGRYRIFEKIGEGGMGEVYRATDTRLGRDVAIKVLPEGFTRDPERLARFEREAQVLASLNHPNIATIHGVEEAEGVRYLVLELVDGMTLRSKLVEGALPIKTVIRLAVQIAEGLAKAHQAGIVHRDFKPDNLMLTNDGFIKILDFGLAKAAVELDGRGSLMSTEPEVRTEPGRIMGTSSYMSPEQARGAEVDHRSDQFAFGSVLYEMATGTRAFGGPTAADTLVAIMRFEPERPEDFDARVPPPLRWLIERCLAKDPVDRYESTRDLAHDLRNLTERLREISDPVLAPRAVGSGSASVVETRPSTESRRRRHVAFGAAAAIVAAAALASVLVGPRLRAPAAPAGPELDPNRVVFVPFDNRTGESDNNVIGLLVADWLTHGMPETAGLTVIASSSAAAAARRVGGGPGTSLDVAKEVGAGTVVAGAYYRQGDLLQIKAEVVAAATGELLHAVDPVSGPISEPMPVVELLRERVLGLLAGRDPYTLEFTPPTLEAYREFVTGREMWIEQPAPGLEHFQRSFELDPDFLPPRLWSVHALVRLGRQGDALAVLDELDDRRGELGPFERLSIDAVRFYVEKRYNEALPVLREVVVRDPLNPHTRNGHAQVALWTNHPQETVTSLEALGDWHELGYPQLYTLCGALHMLGQHERELEVARHAFASFPSQRSPVFNVVRAMAALGRTDELAELVDERFPDNEARQVSLAREASFELRAHGSAQAAREMAERTLARSLPKPNLLLRTRRYLATLMLVADRPEDARAGFGDLLSAHPDDVTFVGSFGAAAARLDDRQTAQSASRRLEELASPQFFGEDDFWRACIAAGLGDREEAVEHLRAALQAGFRFSLEFHRHPFLDPLRGFEDFEVFLRPKG